MSRISRKMIDLLCSRSRSQQNFKMSVNVCPDDTSKHGVVMHQHEPDCLSKDWCAVFKIKITVKDHNSYNQNMTFCMFCELLILLQLNLVWWHITISWVALWKNWIAVLWSRPRSQESSKFQWMFIWMISPQLLNLLLANLAWRYIIMRQCHARRSVCCLQGHSYTKGSYNQIWLFLKHLLNYWSFCKKIFIRWYIIISWSVLCKNWVDVFKVKVTVVFLISVFILIYPISLIFWQPN